MHLFKTEHQLWHGRRFVHRMKVAMNKIIIALTIVCVISIISIMICCLAALGYNSKVTMQEKKIEVDTTKSDLNQQ